MSRELLQQALDVLDGPSTFRKSFNARAALRAALAQPEPEPVTFEQAWATYEAKGYQYGKDALEQVRFGWEIAHEFALAAPPAAPIDGFGGNLDEAFDRTASHCEGRYVSVPAPAVREPQDERIRWRDAVIKEAESALRTAEQEFADMPTWANMGHAAKKVTHALAVIAVLGIRGGGK